MNARLAALVVSLLVVGCGKDYERTNPEGYQPPNDKTNLYADPKDPLTNEQLQKSMAAFYDALDTLKAVRIAFADQELTSMNNVETFAGYLKNSCDLAFDFKGPDLYKTVAMGAQCPVDTRFFQKVDNSKPFETVIETKWNHQTTLPALLEINDVREISIYQTARINRKTLENGDQRTETFFDSKGFMNLQKMGQVRVFGTAQEKGFFPAKGGPGEFTGDAAYRFEFTDQGFTFQLRIFAGYEDGKLVRHLQVNKVEVNPENFLRLLASELIPFTY